MFNQSAGVRSALQPLPPLQALLAAEQLGKVSSEEDTDAEEDRRQVENWVRLVSGNFSARDDSGEDSGLVCILATDD